MNYEDYVPVKIWSEMLEAGGSGSSCSVSGGNPHQCPRSFAR